MPRRLRITYPGALYHITDRGNRKADIFLCDRDRRLFLKKLGEVCVEESWRCLAYCLMTNHYHFVVRTDEPGLSHGMQTLNSRYAEHFNLAYTRAGHVFQGRYRDFLIENERYLMTVIRYVELNAVQAGLCASAGEWLWNSYAAVIGERLHSEWFDRKGVLALFASDPEIAVTRFKEFVAAGDPHAPLARTPRRRAVAERDDAIRRAYASGDYPVRVIAQMFGVSKRTVERVVVGQYRHRGV